MSVPGIPKRVDGRVERPLRIDAAPFFGKGYRKVRARLRLRGARTAPRRVRRLMREHDLSAPNRPPQRPANDADSWITTDRVDETLGHRRLEVLGVDSFFVKDEVIFFPRFKDPYEK